MSEAGHYSITATPVAFIGDENARRAPAPLEQGAAPCSSDAASNRRNLWKNDLLTKLSAFAPRPAQWLRALIAIS